VIARRQAGEVRAASKAGPEACLRLAAGSQTGVPPVARNLRSSGAQLESDQIREPTVTSCVNGFNSPARPRRP